MKNGKACLVIAAAGVGSAFLLDTVRHYATDSVS